MNENEATDLVAFWNDDDRPDWLAIEDRPGWFVDRRTGVLGMENPGTGAPEEVPVADPEGTSAWLVAQYEAAAEQAKAWDRQRQGLQRAIIRLAPAKRALYGDRLLTVVAGGETTKVVGETFAKRLQALLADAEHHEWREMVLLQVLAAGTRWTRDALPVIAREVYDQIAIRTPRADHISITPSLRAVKGRERRV